MAGLDKEGIYRVSGKHTDVSELKLRVEKDVHSVNLEDDTWDIHVVAGLVKMYLRHLPMPVFPFPAKERLEYARKWIMASCSIPFFCSTLPRMQKYQTKENGFSD